MHSHVANHVKEFFNDSCIEKQSIVHFQELQAFKDLSLLSVMKSNRFKQEPKQLLKSLGLGTISMASSNIYNLPPKSNDLFVMSVTINFDVPLNETSHKVLNSKMISVDSNTSFGSIQTLLLRNYEQIMQIPRRTC